MPRTKTGFEPGSIVVARESFTGEIDGAPYVVRIGDRRRAEDAPVQLHPYFFQRDGEILVPWERPEIDDEPRPAPKPRPVVRTLPGRQDWSGTLEAPGAYPGAEPERLKISLHAGRTLPEDTPWLLAFTDRQRRQLFEIVED